MRSAGLLPYRVDRSLEVLIAHPGGPYFARKDSGSWSVVKGEVKLGEQAEEAAAREFEEETGWWSPPRDLWVPLGETTLKSRKLVIVWAVEHEFDVAGFTPGTFLLHSREYPEIDRVEWMGPDEARAKLNPAQRVFIDRLEAHLGLNVFRKE